MLATTLAVALVALLLVPPTLVSAHHTTVTGVPTCLSDGTYSVSWSALNSESDKEIVTLTATLSLSEQDIGTVAMSPIPVPFNGTATGTSTHPGTTPGTLTLTVDAEWDNGVTNSSFGSVTLAGTCTPDTGKIVVRWFNDPDQPPPPTPTINLTIVKQVTADAGAVAPDAGTLFDFELDCIGTDVNFSLADGESRTVTFTGATQCSLTETNDNGADSVTGEFSNELISSNRTVTVVNNYEGVVVLGTAITKVLTTADPAAVGERVSFDVTVTFEGTILPDAEFVDVYENEFLSFESATSGFAPVACDRFASTPDAAHDTVVCPAGDLTSGSATMTLHFTALKGTLGDRTLDEAKVVSDLDGPGGDPPLMIGPAFDDVEIVEYEGVVVLGTAITKVLTTADPAAVGERVSFDVTVTFEGTILPDAEFVDVYENEFLSFESATSGFAPVACDRFASTPDAAHDTVVCPAGDLTSGSATMTLHFTALKGTLGDRTLDEAKVVSDLDGPGGDPPLMIGPAFDDVEIVEVLALPPLGDGSLSGQGGAPLALVVALAALAVASAAMARRLVREGARA